MALALAGSCLKVPRITIGARLDNKYLVTRRLGGGGFGEVYLAQDEEIKHRQVAIKVLARPDGADQGDLLWEMNALASFNHPHVVTFFHHFSDPTSLYLVMEYCPGGSLDDRLRHHGAIPVQQVFAWGLELCETLAFVHGKKIVHHDIKPQNILFTVPETIKLGDFGVANRLAGTSLYLPPEMLLRENVSRLDPRVDIYALGLTLLESITGCHPFEDVPEEEAVRTRIEHRFVPADLDRWVQELLLKATHPTPEMRFQTAEDFAEAIRGRHVTFVFNDKHIKADTAARNAEVAIARRKWKRAERLACYALELNPDCVSALLAAGRCQLLMRHLDLASEYFSRAVSISPRTHVQKELGWIRLEQGQLPAAISLLSDHLQREASDYEAYNLLLKCFYLTDRFEAGQSLAQTLISAKAPSGCFANNLLLFRLGADDCTTSELKGLAAHGGDNPFVAYNARVATEKPPAWGQEPAPSLKSKLLFEEYRFGTARSAARENRLAIYFPDGRRDESAEPIVTIGSFPCNDVSVRDPAVSRRHCTIVNLPGDVWLYDLDSTGGTTVDGHEVSGRLFLDGVHEVEIGNTRIRVATRSDLLV